MEHLYIFNPDCELAIANGGRYYTSPANIVQMADDLAFLPAFMGKAGDRVLVKNKPDREFMRSVYEALAMECLLVVESELQHGPALTGEPWGVSPKMCHWLSVRGMGEEWRTEQKEWYSRKMARKGLLKLFEVIPGLDKEIIPRICYSLVDIGQEISGGDYLLKAPWSSSGKGLLSLAGSIGVKEKEWLCGMLRRQGYLMLEKRLNKEKDFAMEFYSGEEGVEFVGWSAFYTGDHGEYKGNLIGSQEKLEQMLAGVLREQEMERLCREMPRMLRDLLPDYRGYLGVDMMVYRDLSGRLCLQPCVEINLRYNMGIVALFLSKLYVGSDSEGVFEIRFYPGEGEALCECTRRRREQPAIYKNNRIISGYLNLTPVNETTHFVASVSVIES